MDNEQVEYITIDVEGFSMSMAEKLFNSFLAEAQISPAEIYEPVEGTGDFKLKDDFAKAFEDIQNHVKHLMYKFEKDEEDDEPDNEAGTDDGDDPVKGKRVRYF